MLKCNGFDHNHWKKQIGQQIKPTFVALRCESSAVILAMMHVQAIKSQQSSSFPFIFGGSKCLTERIYWFQGHLWLQQFYCLYQMQSATISKRPNQMISNEQTYAVYPSLSTSQGCWDSKLFHAAVGGSCTSTYTTLSWCLMVSHQVLFWHHRIRSTGLYHTANFSVKGFLISSQFLLFP